MALKDIKVRQITDEDMLEVSSWYVSRRWKVSPNPATLPETGYVSVLNGRLLGIVWLYCTNSGIGILDWVATNPESGTKGLISLKNIVEYIYSISSVENGGGINTYIHFTHNDKLAQYFFKKLKFADSDKVNMCIKVIKTKEV